MSLVLEILKDKLAAEVAPADVELVSGMIADKLRSDADMASINTAIGNARTEFAILFKAADTKTAADATMPVGFRAPPNKAEERLAVATSGGNPFMPATINLTRQVMIEHADPELAARMRAEAGSSR